ncbi:MAG: indole-3-glycerol phosphate synthase TrpC [Pelagibacteraceae bacterium]
MKNILDNIINDKKISLKIIKEKIKLNDIEEKIKSINYFYNFKEAITKNKKITIISEIKKASPSAGVIIKDFDHLSIAKTYVDNGATCLSVLTEEKYFLGKLDYIEDIKKKIKLPILAKDFFIDPYQVLLSKSFGCDCILIILAALDDSQADEIYQEAIKNDLSIIIEVHDLSEAKRALKFKEAIIGINNRNLKTLEISLNNTLEIYKVLKDHSGPIISESGIKDENDVKLIFNQTGIKNFLIGESLLNSNDTAELMRKIFAISQ